MHLFDVESCLLTFKIFKGVSEVIVQGVVCSSLPELHCFACWKTHPRAGKSRGGARPPCWGQPIPMEFTLGHFVILKTLLILSASFAPKKGVSAPSLYDSSNSVKIFAQL